MNNSICILILSFLAYLPCKGQGNTIETSYAPILSLPKSELSSEGMNQDTIKKLIHLIRTNPPNDFRGLVVLKNNKVVVEEYFNTFWRESIEDIRSAGKGITALLLGIAIDKGLVKNTEQNVYDYFPAPKFIPPPHDEHRTIKIKHLLAMSSGLHTDDDDSSAPGNTDKWLTRDNWVNIAMGLPIIFIPGQKYVYNDVCPMLVGAIVEETSGKKLADFARENLFAPLGIKEYYWYTAPNGRTTPMGNLYLSTVDFAKIGQLVLSKGTWQGKQIVSSAWIREIAQSQFDISKVDPFASGYGYFWFKGKKEVSNKQYEYLYASGNGGNLLIVVPSQNLVVALTSSAFGQGYGHRRSWNIFEYVLKSLN
jgi:CubicO group peptidase (beta-lactamase class C family)